MKLAPTRDGSLYLLDQFDLLMIIGVYPHERTARQTLLVSLRIEFVKPYGPTVEVKIHNILKSYARSQQPLLLERMAYDLAQHVWAETATKTMLVITIQKPQALADAQHSFVTLEMHGAARLALADKRYKK